jgi:hypothetical protein
LDDSSSDDDDSFIASTADTFSNVKKKHGGSIPGHRVIYRDREGGHERMFKDYLAENPTYSPETFRRRFMFFHFYMICCMFINIIVVVNLWIFFLRRETPSPWRRMPDKKSPSSPSILKSVYNKN